jgi:hypothetical protein
MATASRKTWLTISLSGAMTVLIVAFLASLPPNSVVGAAGIFQDKRDNSVEAERASPANNYGFSEATPSGDWSAQVDLDSAQLDDPRVPVAVAGLKIYAGKGNWGKQRMIQSVTLAHRTPKAVAKVRLGWIIITKEAREARKNQEAALVKVIRHCSIPKGMARL